MSIDHMGTRIDYLTPQQVSARWRGEIKTGTLAQWRNKRIGPPYRKFGRAVLYPVGSLVEWEKRQEVRT